LIIDVKNDLDLHLGTYLIRLHFTLLLKSAEAKICVHCM